MDHLCIEGNCKIQLESSLGPTVQSWMETEFPTLYVCQMNDAGYPTEPLCSGKFKVSAFGRATKKGKMYLYRLKMSSKTILSLSISFFIPLKKRNKKEDRNFSPNNKLSSPQLYFSFYNQALPTCLNLLHSSITEPGGTFHLLNISVHNHGLYPSQGHFPLSLQWLHCLLMGLLDSISIAL